jgi:hypothetical protein
MHVDFALLATMFAVAMPSPGRSTPSPAAAAC